MSALLIFLMSGCGSSPENNPPAVASDTAASTALNVISIVSSGPGEYAVTADNFSNIGGVEVTITYDTGTFANPRITPGSLLAGTMFVQNLSFSQSSLKFAAISLSAISGSGTLATINFDARGTPASTPEITVVKIAPLNGTPVAVPEPVQPPAPSAGAMLPAAGVIVTTAGTATP